jgi:NitT/TauT family transport system ATP-binding protein
MRVMVLACPIASLPRPKEERVPQAEGLAPRSPADDSDAEASQAAIQYRDLSVVYGWGRTAIVALDAVDLDVGQNEFVAVIGPSGCGKSTLLRVTAGLINSEFVQGQVLVNGQSPDEARRANSFAFVFQDPVLAPWRTVLQNVRLPLEVVPAGRGARRTPAELVKLVGLEGFENALPSALSGGMRQRVSLARSLCLDPSVLLMDEPFGALDELTRDRMHDELLGIWATTNAAVLLITHSIVEAAFLADRVVVMTARPGSVKRVVSIPFPRPRSPQLKTTVEFLDKTNEIRAALEPSR